MMMIAALAAAALTPAEMTRVADAFDRAQLTQDRAKLETLIDDGLVYIDGSGKPFSIHFRFSDTFRRVGGKWKAIHIQVTRIGG